MSTETKTTRAFMAGGCRPLRRRSTTGRRREPIQPRGSPVEEESSTVRERRPGVAAPLGDLERRVHGGQIFRALSASSFTGPSGHQMLPPPGSTELSEEASRAAVEATLQQKKILGLFFDEIEKSIVVPICLNPSAREFFPDHTRRHVNYLTAAKNLLQLRQHPLVASGDHLHDRARCLLGTAMSSLATAFCYLRVWRPDALRGAISPAASIWESVSVRSCCSGGSAASSASCACSSFDPVAGTSGSNDASFGAYHAAELGEDQSVRSGDAFSGISYIDLSSLSTLDNIAEVMIEGGYEQMLRETIDRRPDLLARHIEVLDIDNILGSHMEESREKLMKVWIEAMRIIVSVLAEMRRQLNGQDFGHFNTLKADYFMAIAKVSITRLLNSASSLCIHVGAANVPSCNESYAGVKHSPSKIINVVMMFQALKYAMPTMLSLFFGRTKESILQEAEGFTNGLSVMLVKLFDELDDLLRSQHLVIPNTGVHRVTLDIMHHLGFLVQHKNTVYIMLKGNLDEFDQRVKQLISSLESMLETSSRSLRFQGQQQVFLLNNLQFMLEQAKNADVGLILGQSWLSQRHDNLDQYTASYVEASWTPVMSSLDRRSRVPEILWPHQLLDKFTSSFEMTCSVQKTWKVTDPLVRQKLRKAISQKVIPLYRMHMENYSEKKQKSAIYSIEQLESQLLEMFEG